LPRHINSHKKNALRHSIILLQTTEKYNIKFYVEFLGFWSIIRVCRDTQ